MAQSEPPPLVDKAAIAILRTNGSATIPYGSGTLFQIADCGFVVTAGHVVKTAHAIRDASTRPLERIPRLSLPSICSPLGVSDLRSQHLTRNAQRGMSESVRNALCGNLTVGL